MSINKNEVNINNETKNAQFAIPSAIYTAAFIK